MNCAKTDFARPVARGPIYPPGGMLPGNAAHTGGPAPPWDPPGPRGLQDGPGPVNNSKRAPDPLQLAPWGPAPRLYRAGIVYKFDTDIL